MKWLVGLTFAVTVLSAVFLTLGVLGVALSVVFRHATGPFEKPALVVMSVAILGVLAAFFWMVAGRLLASLRGQPVPHLFPPVVGLAAGGIVGVLFVCMAVAWATGAKVNPGAAQGLVYGPMFLGYAGLCLKRMRH